MPEAPKHRAAGIGIYVSLARVFHWALMLRFRKAGEGMGSQKPELAFGIIIGRNSKALWPSYYP